MKDPMLVCSYCEKPKTIHVFPLKQRTLKSPKCYKCSQDERRTKSRKLLTGKKVWSKSIGEHIALRKMA